MNNLVQDRCHCGEPMSDNGTCSHCDFATPSCNITTLHDRCKIKQHPPGKCPRCKGIAAWLPEPGEFDDLPNGYEDKQ